MKIISVGLAGMSALAAAPLLAGIAITWFGYPQLIDHRLTLAHPKSRLSEAGSRSRLRGSLALWAAACGVAMVVMHTATTGVGARIGVYRTGLATLALFVLAGVLAALPRFGRLPALAPGASGGRPQNTREPYPGLSHPLIISWFVDPERRLRLHIGVAIGAMLPLWWHCEVGRASTADLILKTTAILLVMSGFFGIAITEVLRGAPVNAKFIKSWFAVHRGLALLTFLLITMHLLVVLYFAGV